MDTVYFSIVLSIVLALLLLIIAAAIIVPLANKISSSLSLATRRLQELANGDLTTEVIQSKANDETTILTSALSKTITSLNNYIHSIETCLGALSSGDYTIHVPDDFHGDFVSIQSSLSNITESLNHTMLQVNHSSKEVNKIGRASCRERV